MTIAPLPLTYAEINNDSGASGIVLLFYMGIGISFIPAMITSFIVKERETSMKH